MADMEHQQKLIGAGKRIKDRIELEIGVSQNEASRRTNFAVSQPWISGVVAGRYDVTKSHPDKIAEFLKFLQWTPQQFEAETGLTITTPTRTLLPDGYALWPLRSAHQLAEGHNKIKNLGAVAYPLDKLGGIPQESVGFVQLDPTLGCYNADGSAYTAYPADWVGVTQEMTESTTSLSWWKQGKAFVLHPEKGSPVLADGSTIPAKQLKSLGYVAAIIQ
jgi:hypothetical protein